MNEAASPSLKSPLVIDYRSPHPMLRRWVSHYYTLARRDKRSSQPIIQRMYPSDGTGLIFQQAGQVEVMSSDGHWAPHPPAFAKGHFQKPFLAKFAGPYRLVCVAFRPGMAHHFLWDSQSLINNRFVSLQELFGGAAIDLAEKVLLGRDLNSVGPILDEFLRERLSVATQIQRTCDYAVTRIALSGGTVPINAVAEMCRQSPRSLERAFRSALGMTPKYFSETVRFRAFLRRLRTNPHERVAAAAQECGYFDQAHQIREFRRFTGTCPSQFWSQAEAIEAATTDIRMLSAVMDGAVS